jgi:hypothetical protein
LVARDRTGKRSGERERGCTVAQPDAVTIAISFA